MKNVHVQTFKLPVGTDGDRSTRIRGCDEDDCSNDDWRPRARQRLRGAGEARLNLLVVVSAVAGYAMAHGDTTNLAALWWMVVGTGLVSGGASAINQVIERETDGLMRRTRLRPLPDGRLSTIEG